MKKMILCACAGFAFAMFCFGFLSWNSGTITSDPVQVVKLTPCQYRQSPGGQLLPGVEETAQSLTTGRLYTMLCTANSSHLDVGDEVTLIGSTIPGYTSPPSGILTLIRFTGVFALAIGFWLLIRLLRAARKTHLVKG